MIEEDRVALRVDQRDQPAVRVVFGANRPTAERILDPEEVVIVVVGELGLVRERVAEGDSCLRVVLVARVAEADLRPADLDLAAAPLWGFGRSVAVESPALGCRLFDLDPAAEPLADVSIFPTYLVSKLAREHVTVVLSGDGGDELFAGYEWYVADKIARYYRYLPTTVSKGWFPQLSAFIPPSPSKKGLVNKFKRFVEGSALPDSLQHFRWSTFLTPEMRQRLYSPEMRRSLEDVDTYSRFAVYLSSCERADPLWQQQFADIKTYLPDDILAKVDRMSMAVSLEARTPYLDYRVAEFAASLPSKLKLNGLKTKYLLKRCMAGRLPPAILNRKKEGFSIPMKNWLKQELRPMMEELLSPTRLRREGFFNPAYVEKLKADHLRGVANYSHQLWSLMVFEIWQDAYLHP